jgi:Histone-binding protein RBBP4 or subunit C of CAF1 complex
LPTIPLDEDCELVHDPRAYDMFHELGVEWPCLSFDILKDRLGDERVQVNRSFIAFRDIFILYPLFSILIH